MLDHALRVLQKEIQRFDPKLFLKKDDSGKIFLMRKSQRMLPYWIDDESYVLYNHDDADLVFPFTSTFTSRGYPVKWGVLPVLQRLREIDGWNRDVLKEVRDHNEKYEESKSRDFRNNAEAFFSDHRDHFKKAWSDLNTSTVEKKDSRWTYDRKLKK